MYMSRVNTYTQQLELLPGGICASEDLELAIIIEEDLPPVAPAHLLGRHRVASVVGQADHSVCLLSIRSDNDGTNFNLYPKLPLTLSHLIAKGERSSEAKEITGL